MADKSPFPFHDVSLDWGLSGPVPQFFIGDDFRPLDVENVSETSVGECLEFLGVCFGYTPGFRTIK